MSVNVPPVKTIPLDKINGPDKNPNDMAAEDFDTLCELIKTEGFLQPLLVKEHFTKKGQYQVIDGDHRFKALNKLNVAEVPCVVLPRDFSDSKAALLQISLNKLRGQLDHSAVARSLQDIIDAGDIDPTLSGFNQSHIDDLLTALNGSADPIDELLGTGEESGRQGRPPKIEQFVLEIAFETGSQLKAAKKALKARGNGDLTQGLLSCLEV
jgi:ParB/RepB/Spo0J family partition protein